MSKINFIEFPKIPRLFREIVITEKIDGTNAQIAIIDENESPLLDSSLLIDCNCDGLFMYAASRNRYITPDDDNYGFAKWVAEHSDELFALGVGRHYGEWWGKGIQRGYGLDEKRFSLFNVNRWVDPGHVMEDDGNDVLVANPVKVAPPCCHVVPVIYQGPFEHPVVEQSLEFLQTYGSQAAPGFKNPEGVCVYHTHAKQYFKVTFDDRSKYQL